MTAPAAPAGLRGRIARVLRSLVFRNAVQLFLVSVINYLMPLILIPYLARALGIEHYGVYAFGMSIYLIGMILIDYGFPVQGLYAIAEHREDRERVGRLLGSMMAIKLAVFTLLTVALGVYVALNDRFTDHKLFLMLMALPVLGGALQFRWVFQAVEQSGKIVRYMTVGRLVQVALVFAVVSSPADYLWVPVIHGFAMMVAGVMCIVMIHQLGYRFLWPSWRDIRTQLREAASYFWANVAEAQLGFAGIFSLSHVAAPAALAVYAVAEQLYRALRSLAHPFIDALMPWMKRSNDVRTFKRLCYAVFGLTALGVALGVLLAPWVIHLLFGAKYAAATPILRILLPALLAFVPASMIGYALLSAVGHGAAVSRVAVVSAVLTAGIFALLWVLGRLDSTTVALTVVASEVMIFAGTMGLVWRYRAARRGAATVPSSSPSEPAPK